MPDTFRRSLREVPWVFLSRAFQLVCSLTVSVLVPRSLSISEYGAFRLVFSGAAVAYYFTSLGLEAALGRYIPEFITRNQRGSIRQLIKAATLVRILLIALVLGVATAVQAPLFHFFNIPDFLQRRIIFVVLYIFATQTHSLLGSTLHNAYLHQRFVSLIEIGSNILRLALVAIVLYLHLGFSSLLGAFVIVEIAVLTTYLFFIPSSLGYADSVSRSDWQRIFKFALFVCLAPLGTMLLDFSIDNLIIAHFLGMESVGLYAFAAMQIQILGNLNPGMFLKNVASFFFIEKHTQAESPAQVSQALDKGNQTLIKLSLFVLLPVSFSIVMMGHAMISIFFEGKFFGALPPLHWLLVCFMIQNTFIYGLSHIFNTLERLNLRLYGYLGAGLFNFVLEILLVPRIGILGAAIATGSSSILLCLYYYWIIHHQLAIKLSLPYSGMGKILLMSTLVALFQWVTLPWVVGPISFCLIALSAVLLYLSLACKLHPFDKREMEFARIITGRKTKA